MTDSHNLPPPETPPLPPELAPKLHSIRQFLDDGSYPTTAEGAASLLNPVQLLGTRLEQMEDGAPVRTRIAGFIGEKRPLDPFTLEAETQAIMPPLLNEVWDPDMLDLALLTHAFMGAHWEASADVRERGGVHGHAEDRAAGLVEAATLAIAHAADFRLLISRREFDMWGAYRSIFPIVGDHPGWEMNMRVALEQVQGVVQDRLALGRLIQEGNLSSLSHGIGRANAYNAPLSEQKRDKLNEAAADTVERLHLLRAYGVTPIEVRGADIGLPWDIAVIPPATGEIGVQAEGAIADFVILRPTDIDESQRAKVQYEKDDASRRLLVRLGERAALQRFRLHDNGQISYGSRIHNVPSDYAEEDFRRIWAHDAFTRLRGLFIALAFDAVVPDEVVSSADIGGSVATSFRPAPEHVPAEERITEILLPRRQALRRAGVSNKNRQPKGWQPPRDRRGYTMRMRPGYRARPTADEEARQYHARIGIAYQYEETGLPENMTWVPPREGDPAEVTFRRARFRSSAATKQHLGALGVRPGRGRRGGGKGGRNKRR